MVHPRLALFDAGDRASSLPVCDHYAGIEARMRKSLALQRELGPVFDVTLDCEDGAPVGGERDHAQVVRDLALSADNQFGRVGVRVHPFGHPAFETDLAIALAAPAPRWAYLMLPKPRNVQDVEQAVLRIDAQYLGSVVPPPPVHVLIETHGALRDVQAIASHPRVESLSFGLMDFVSAHRGAIPGDAMTAQGQFSHPLVARAKLEIAAACHAHAKTPSHNVVTEFRDSAVLSTAVRRASREFGFTRMWSIHPNQIPGIVAAFTPDDQEVESALDILDAGMAADWAPVAYRSQGTERLHDRASYRYYWHILERAHRVGMRLPAEALSRYFG